MAAAPVEGMEARRLLSAAPYGFVVPGRDGCGTLVVVATNGGDTINVTEAVPGQVTVTVVTESNPAEPAIFSGLNICNVIVDARRCGDRIIVDTVAADTFADAGGGDDIVTVIATGTGHAAVTGGSGNDRFTNISGNVAFFGEGGNDVMVSAGGTAFMSGGDGNDLMANALGTTFMFGGRGDDTFEVSGPDSFADGGEGGETLGDTALVTGGARTRHMENTADQVL